MISCGTNLTVIDNSGAKKVKCLKVLGSSSTQYGFIGNVIVISIQRINPVKKLKKGEIFKAVIIAIKKKRVRVNGSFVSFNMNGVVIINNKKLPIATRVLGPVMAELRQYNFSKILSMSTIAI